MVRPISEEEFKKFFNPPSVGIYSVNDTRLRVTVREHKREFLVVWYEVNEHVMNARVEYRGTSLDEAEEAYNAVLNA